jgi:hypothetical protein
MAHAKDYLDGCPIYIDSGPRFVRLLELLLKALTRAVYLQIEFWNVLEQLKELVTVGFDPARWVSTTSTIVDGDGDLTMADVDDYLGPSA